MEFSVSVKTSQVDDHIRKRVEQRLYFALGRFQRRIERVRVRLEDTNGPTGGVDQRCRIVVRLHGLRDVVIDQLDANIYAALNRAADRAGRAVRLDRATPRSSGADQRGGQEDDRTQFRFASDQSQLVASAGAWSG